MPYRNQSDRTKIVSFSGIDGAGKSTQIQSLRLGLEERGFSVKIVTFWDDIARLKGLREKAGHTLFKGDKGVGSPSAPINRRDKNVKSWPMTMVRLILYLIDVLSLRQVAKRALHSTSDLVIFDRYSFDELANLHSGNLFTRVYIRLIIGLTPKPDISFLLDADPIQARARKPEYPVEFLVVNRNSYLELCRLIDGMIVVPPRAIDEAKQIVMRCTLDLFESKLNKNSNPKETPAECTVSALNAG